jgi:hypothetical protein
VTRVLALVVLSACAATTITEAPGPRGLRADQHQAIAHREDERADELSRWPEPSAGLPGIAPPIGVWYARWDVASEHRNLAEEHRTLAAALEQDYEQACENVPADDQRVSPLARYGSGGTNIDHGVVVVLSLQAGPAERLMAAMRCHRAWMMLGRTDMDDCPLDLPGVHVAARGDGTSISVELTTSDPALVPELQRRAAHELEVAGKR